MKCHWCIREYAAGNIAKADIKEAVSQAAGTVLCFNHCLTNEERKKVTEREAKDSEHR